MSPSMSRALVLALIVAACTNTATPMIQETRQSHAGDFSLGEAVTVVRLLSEVGDETASCVGRSIHESEAGINVVSSSKFRDGMFPWFEPGTTPTTVNGLAELMGMPAVKRRIEEFGVRYVVAVGGDISKELSNWGGVEQLGPLGGVFAGGVSYKNSTRLAAVILDLKQARPVGEVSASAEGGGGFGLVFIVPYFVAGPDTEAITCEVIANRVVGFLKGEPQPPDQKVGKKKP